MQGPIHWELLKPGTSITSKTYCEQLRAVDLSIKVRRAQGYFNGPLIFHHDNAPPHRSQTTKACMETELGWDVLPHPPYSPDIAASDFHRFRSLKNFLRGRRFTKAEEFESAIGEYFASKAGTDFYKKGIRKLPGQWHKVVEKQGDYFIE